MKEELRPIVREAITEEIMRGIQKMVHLVPDAVDALGEQVLDSEDRVIQSRAANTIIKYTIGHPALVQPKDGDGSKQININFGLPRPDHIDAEVVEDAPTETRVCDLCHEEKPTTEFIGESERCQSCVDEWKAKITEQFG